MADKKKIVKVMEFVKIGFKVLQDIILEVLSLNTATFIIKSRKITSRSHHFFTFFIKTENLLNKHVGLANNISLWTPQKRTKAAEMGKSSFEQFISFILNWSHSDHT